MSHSASTPSRQRRGGRNRSRHSDRPSEHGSRDQHDRQKSHRDTETFQRPKGGPKLTFWQKILSAIGFGPKPPLRRADRPDRVETTQPVARAARPQSPDREPTESHDARPPREPRSPRPVIHHDVTSGRLYIGNLSYDVSEADLTDLFGGVGQVQQVEIVVNRATQRSKGFAFVEMLTIDEAKRAVAELHDKEYMGRKMLVTGAKPADPTRFNDSESPPRESPPRESRNSEFRTSEPRSIESRTSEPRSFEPRSGEYRSSDGRPPRRESRPASGPATGDVTTGIIRREQLPTGPSPVAGPVAAAAGVAAVAPPAPEPAAELPATDPAASSSPES